MMRGLILFALLCLPLPAVAQDEEVKVFMVNEYRYEAQASQGDPEIGHSLCGTRCNALSTEYLSIMGVEGWNLLEIAQNQEQVVALDNPFLTGRCVCNGTTYLARKTLHVTQRPMIEEIKPVDEGKALKNSRRWYEPPIQQ